MSTRDRLSLDILYYANKSTLKEGENTYLSTFMNKYKPLYDTKPRISNDGTVIADQICLRGSGIPKHIEASLYPSGNMEVGNEEWGFVCTSSGIDYDSVERMSQYWFYDDYQNNPDFKARIDSAAEGLYKDMVKLRDSLGVETNINESLTPDEEKELERLKAENKDFEEQLATGNLKGDQRIDIKNDIMYNNKKIAELESKSSNNNTDKSVKEATVNISTDLLSGLIDSLSSMINYADDGSLDKNDPMYEDFFNDVKLAEDILAKAKDCLKNQSK